MSKRRNGLRGVSGAPQKASCGSSGTLLAANWSPLAPPWALLGASGTLLVRSWRRFFSKIPETSPGGSDFPGFQLRLVTKTCEIQPKACENHCENLPAAPRLERRIPTRVRRSREASSIRRTLRLRRERSVHRQCFVLSYSLRTRGACLPLPLHRPPRVRRTPPI